MAIEITNEKLAVIQWCGVISGSLLAGIICLIYGIPVLFLIVPLCLVGVGGIAAGMRP